MAAEEPPRCKRTGTSWRCPERSLPGKTYCQKHHLYNISRTQRRRKINTLVGPSNSVVPEPEPEPEPYRPLLDFDAAEVSGGGCVLDEGEIMGWLLGGADGGTDGISLGTASNDQFALPEPGVGGESVRRIGRFGGNCNDGIAPAIFSEGNKCCLLGDTTNNEDLVEKKKNESYSLGLGRGVERQFEESGCADNVIVLAMEAHTGGVGGIRMPGRVQKRTRGTIGSKTRVQF